MIIMVLMSIGGVVGAQSNQAPVVRIVKPVSAFAAGPVPYAIQVTDQEDGDSEFGEIPSGEVLMVIRHLADTIGYRQKATLINEMLPGLFSLREANCLSCHAATSQLIGPSFARVAGRYNVNQADLLVKKVRSGGSGVWGDVQMPAHPDLEENGLRSMINWILNYGSDGKLEFKTGTSGVFRTRADAVPGGGCLVVAAYRDRGHPAVPGSSKSASVSKLLMIK